MSEKSIVWIHRMGPTFASYRYRAAMPAEEVGKINGYRTALNGGEADILVFSKPVAEDLAIAERAKADGAKIIADLADDHFQTDETYMQFAKLADGIVCASDIMRGRIYDYAKRHAVAIPDPYEQPEVAPHADCEGNLQHLWFGHQVNIHAMLDQMPLMKGRDLRVVTGPRQFPNATLWTPESMKTAFAQSNIVLLPCREGDDFKSANRLVNSLRAGCFAVCMDHPSYKEFRDFVWVGLFYTGLQWSTAFRADLNDLVKAGQDYIRDRYSPAAIGARWASFLESV